MPFAAPFIVAPVPLPPFPILLSVILDVVTILGSPPSPPDVYLTTPFPSKLMLIPNAPETPWRGAVLVYYS